jgi:hypothetical protein
MGLLVRHHLPPIGLRQLSGLWGAPVTPPETKTVALEDLELGDPVLTVGADVFADVVSIDYEPERKLWPYRIVLANQMLVKGRAGERVKVLAERRRS